MRGRFPDGQVFVDLHPDASSVPFTPDRLVRRVLRSLSGAPVADHPEEAAARLRDALSRRRVLVVLDNVDGEGQVRPLLVDGARSAVLVAARRELPALPAQFMRRIGALSEADAYQVLEDLLGPARTRAERASAMSILRSSARLPLALHIAGLWLSARPHRSLRDLSDRLMYEQDRIGFLRIGDLSLQASVAAYCRSLPDPVRAALQRMKTVRGDFGLDDVVEADVTPSRGLAADLLDELLDRQMVHVSGVDDNGRVRYRMYDAVRQYLAYGPPDLWGTRRAAGHVWLPQQAGRPSAMSPGADAGSLSPELVRREGVSPLPHSSRSRTTRLRRWPGARRDQAAGRVFDNAKYLAIVMVAMGHAWEPLRDGSRTVTAFHLSVYAFHASPFIVVSDYFARNFEPSPVQLKRLVTGLAVPYVVFETAYTPFTRWTDQVPDRPINAAGFSVSDVVPRGAVHLAADHSAVATGAPSSPDRARRRDARDRG